VKINVDELDANEKWRSKRTILKHLVVNEQPAVFEAHDRNVNGNMGKRMSS
jgi:hypothetical protein